MAVKALPPDVSLLKLDDAEQGLSDHREAIIELQKRPEITVIKDVTLADATLKQIAHGLGRPVTVMISPPRGATATGRIVETRSSSYDRSKYIALTATGHGATITVDLWVTPS